MTEGRGNPAIGHVIPSTSERVVVSVPGARHGKSTTTWGLLHYELQCLSDELAAIDLTTMRVHPFPHALCLKALPPADYPLPEKTIYTARTMHVRTECLPSQRRLEMLRLEAISFFI